MKIDPLKRFHILLTGKDLKRIETAQKKTSFLNKSEFIRILISEALDGRESK